MYANIYISINVCMYVCMYVYMNLHTGPSRGGERQEKIPGPPALMGAPSSVPY